MSIIYESLKKIEKEGTTLQHPIPDMENTARPKSGIPKHIKIIYFCVIFSLAGITIAFFPFKALNKGKPLPKTRRAGNEPKASSARIAAPGKQAGSLPPPPLAPSKLFPPLILNGIFFSENSGYALINNQIVKEGDMIEGVIVKKISENSVELKNSAGVIKLSTQP